MRKPILPLLCTEPVRVIPFFIGPGTHASFAAYFEENEAIKEWWQNEKG